MRPASLSAQQGAFPCQKFSDALLIIHQRAGETVRVAVCLKLRTRRRVKKQGKEEEEEELAQFLVIVAV